MSPRRTARRMFCTPLAWLLLVGLWFGGPALAEMPFGAQTQDQAAFAMGSMVWNVIYVESDGSIDANQEDWNAGQLSLLQNEVFQAANYWEGLTAGFHPEARLSIGVNFVNAGVPLNTGYEPITRSSTQEALWVEDVMDSLGYTSGNRYSRVREFNQQMRTDFDTHWATTIFIVNDEVDADNMFTNDRFAYAYYGGPYTVLTYDNDGWGHDNFNLVLSHEMGHIFMALDEYEASGQRTTYRGGYLNVANGNASLDASGNPITPPQPNALMLNNGNFYTGEPYAPSVFASDMFGHRDTDGDSIPDILDTAPVLNGSVIESDSAGGLWAFSGWTIVNPIDNQNPLNITFSNSTSDMTINTIEAAYYVLDGGDAVTLAAGDGAFGGYIETLQFQIDGLLAGQHAIDIFALNNVGNTSNVLSFLFNSSFSPPPVTLIGDANNDGVVDANDFLAVELNLGSTGALDGLLLGDANDDGRVDGLDFLAVERHFGDTLAPGSSPEPATLLLVVGALLTMSPRRRSRH